VNRAAFLFQSSNVANMLRIYLNPFKAAAASFALEAFAAPVHDISDLESVVAAQAREPKGGLIVMPDGFLNVHRAQIVSLAAVTVCLPSIHGVSSLKLGGCFLTEMTSAICFSLPRLPEAYVRADLEMIT